LIEIVAFGATIMNWLGRDILGGNNQHTVIGLILAILMVAIRPALAENAMRRPLIFGVLNQQSALQTAEYWNPILRYLSKKTGVWLSLKMGPTVDITDKMMAHEEFDLVFTNHSFQEKYDGKYRVLVRRAGLPVKGVLVVHEDSPVKQLVQLAGLTVAFPSPQAFLGYVVPKRVIREAGLQITEKFAGSQDGALAQLKAKLVDAAAVNSSFVAPYTQRENLNYRVIYESEPYCDLPILVHPRLPSDQVNRLKQALLLMHRDQAGREVLSQVNAPGFEGASEADYDNIRAIYRATEP
jgi:phosphonate transport system substrate-binding protein